MFARPDTSDDGAFLKFAQGTIGSHTVPYPTAKQHTARNQYGTHTLS